MARHRTAFVGAEILPGLGLGGLLLGQEFSSLQVDQQWPEVPPILRASLCDGVIEVVADGQQDRIIGLVAGIGYQGTLPGGVGPGTPFEEALRHYPRLGRHELDGSLYEPQRLGFVLYGDGAEPERVEFVLICDWAHEYWDYARPLLREQDLDTSL